MITSLTAFLSRIYFCTNCYKGYNTKEEHACNNVCHNCRRIHDQTEEDWINCQDCGRYFKGSTCFNLHNKTTPLGNSTCTSCYKCKNCGQTVNKRVGYHNCGNVYCKTCKDYYPSGHQCYMLPVDYNDRQKKQTYVLFDFECTHKMTGTSVNKDTNRMTTKNVFIANHRGVELSNINLIYV